MKAVFKHWIVLMFVWTRVESATDTHVRNLIKQLFTTQSYDKLVRPIVDQSKPVQANVEYFLFGVNDVNEIQEKLTTTGYLKVTWTDAFLTWDPTLYGNLQYLYIPQDNVWKPDISLQNGFKNLEQLGSNLIQVYVKYDGRVEWTPFQIFESQCNFDSSFFPFDQQTCNLDFIVWSLDIDDVELFVGGNGIDMDADSNNNGQWNVISSTSSRLEESSESKIRFSISMKRKPLFVVVNIIIPIILLAILNLFTFQIPCVEGERMSYAITVWLSFAVFLTIVSASLPKTSERVPVISVYIIIQITVGTITVLTSAIECRIASYSDDQPVYACLIRIARIFRRASIKPQEPCEKTSIDVTWIDGIAALDRLLFWIVFILLVVTTFITLMVMGLSS